MLKIPTKYSTTLSIVFVVLLLVACGAGAIAMPWFCDLMINARNAVRPNDLVVGTERAAVIVLAYIALSIVIIVATLMLLLLKNVQMGRVFTAQSVGYIRAVSWCCVLLGAVFAVIGHFFGVMFVIAFLIAFLALCLRVVKNVLEEATAIKSENDLTV